MDRNFFLQGFNEKKLFFAAVACVFLFSASAQTQEIVVGLSAPGVFTADTASLPVLTEEEIAAMIESGDLVFRNDGINSPHWQD